MATEPTKWTSYRRWKNGLVVALLIAAGLLIRAGAEGSTRWTAGVALVVLLGVAYLAEEIVWMAKRQGRPCGYCGGKVQLQAFRVFGNCPHCGKAFE